MLRHIPPSEAFTAKVDLLALAAIFDGAGSFSALLRRLPSVYPTEVLASVDRLSEAGKVEHGLAATFRAEAGQNATAAYEGRSLLPVPHPLDFEWRFTADTSRALLDRAAAMTSPGDDLLLFGTPGLAVEALSLPIERRLTFLAENNCVTGRISALNAATGGPLNIAFCSGGLPRESADAVLLDPPWYIDFVRSMLSAAAWACRPGGKVLISLPPDGTRPSAEADRATAIRLGQRMGLKLVEHEPLALRYETPFFERNALAAVGIYAPPQWRRGDLLIFTKSLKPCRPIVADKSYERPWTEISVGRMRLFIRDRDRVRSEQVGLTSLVEGDILPTVSRRDRRRRAVQVWTSGNRVFAADNPQLILEAAISCQSEGSGTGFQPRLWGTISEGEALERVAYELRALAHIESLEELGAPTQVREGSVRWRSNLTSCLTM